MEVNKYKFPVRKDNWRRLFPELFEIRIHDNDIQKLAMALGRTRSVQELVVSTLLPRTLTVLRCATKMFPTLSMQLYDATHWEISGQSFSGCRSEMFMKLNLIFPSSTDSVIQSGDSSSTMRQWDDGNATLEDWNQPSLSYCWTKSSITCCTSKLAIPKTVEGQLACHKIAKVSFNTTYSILFGGNLVSWKCGDWVCCHLPPLQWTCGPSQLEVVTQLASGKTSPGNLGPAEFVPRMPWAFPGWDMTICWRRPLRLNDPTDVWWWRLLSGSQKNIQILYNYNP